MALLSTICSLLAAGLLLGPAEKTDKVLMTNGDLITCEIKKLDRGVLTVKTDTMSVVEVRWVYVERITSEDPFAVELDDGTRRFGYLAVASAPGKLRIVSPPTGDWEVDIDRVIFLDELGLTLLDRVKGNVSLGFTATKASDVAQLSLDFGLRAAAETHQWNLSGSTINTTQAERPNSNRSNLDLGYRHYLGERWFADAYASLQRNDELGLDLRTLVGGGAGRYLVQTRSMLLSAAAGVGVSKEFNAAADPTNNLEGVLSLQYDWFQRQSPKLDLEVKLTAFPSLSETGRVRGLFDAQLRKEFVKDLYLSFKVYTDYDSKPPSGASSSIDYGVVTSIDYSW